MAIDDNTLYGLTGAQVKELPEKIEAVKGLAKELTSADYNWPTSNPTSVALWLLDNGMYVAESDSVNVSITYNKTGLGNGVALVKQLDNENPSRANVIVLKDDSSAIYYGMTADGRNASQYNLYSAVAQTTGTSTTDVMSQNAISSLIFGNISSQDRIHLGNTSSAGEHTVSIGKNASLSGTEITVVGAFASAFNSEATALGALAYAGASSSVALGFGAKTTVKGEVNIGTSNAFAPNTYGYNGSAYRLLTGLYDPQSDHDAATKGYCDNSIPATFTTNEWNALWA